MAITVDAPKTTLRERFAPRATARMEYLSGQLFFGAIIAVLSAVFLSAYGISRVSSHRLSPGVAAAILIGGAGFNALTQSVVSFFTALHDAAVGVVTKDGTEKPSPEADPLSARAVWGRALAGGLAGAAWGTGLALLALATLNRRETHFLGLFVGVLFTAGVASVAAGLAGNALGVRTALDLPRATTPRPARRRAWLQLGVPFALVFGLFTAAFTLLLFHDYHVGSQFSSHVLTSKEVFADLPIQLLIFVPLANFVLGRAGRAESVLGLVTYEDPDRELPQSTAIYGVQAMIWVSIIVYFAGGALLRFIVPSYPTLVETAIARGAFAFVALLIAGPMAYMRGAVNATVTKR
jgi:hypothetical protein